MHEPTITKPEETGGVALPQPCSTATAAHDKAWEQNFVVPIGKEMQRRGIAYMVIIIRDDGKVAYVWRPSQE
jgi:hypothetical protein